MYKFRFLLIRCKDVLVMLEWGEELKASKVSALHLCVVHVKTFLHPVYKVKLLEMLVRPLRQWMLQTTDVVGECTAACSLALLCHEFSVGKKGASIFWLPSRNRVESENQHSDWTNDFDFAWRLLGGQDQGPHLCGAWEACNIWRAGHVKHVKFEKWHHEWHSSN